MPLLAIDFETYWAADYTLSKMQPDEYISDPRFQIIGFAFKEGDQPATWYTGSTEEIDAAIEARRDLIERSALMAHNMAFDGMILAMRYGIYPKVYIDTHYMARVCVAPFVGRASLAKTAEHLGLSAKGGQAQTYRGYRREQFTPAQLQDYGEYCMHDTELSYAAFMKMKGRFTKDEFRVMDLATRLFTEPTFLLDPHILARHLQQVRNDKAALIARANLDSRDELMSNMKFAAMLRNFGVEPPEKISPTTGKPTYAFAKTDPGFKELLEHPDPRVQTLVSARMGVKSTIEETRTERFLHHAMSRRPFPVPLIYYGAHTGRFSGANKLNCMHPDIEVLSRSGWKRIETWQPSDGIMQWWYDGKLSWCDTATKVERDDTELVWFDGPFMRGGYTPDHRMVSVRDGRVVERTAGWVADHSGLDGIPLGGTLEQDGGLSVLQVRFLCAVAADGSIKQHVHSRSLSLGFRKARKIQRMRALLDALGAPYREVRRGTTTCFTWRQLPEWVIKGYGPWVLELSHESMDAVLDEFVHWDGAPHHRNQQPVFYTVHIDQARWLATLAHLRGRSASIYRYNKPRASTGEICHVYIRKSKYTSVQTDKHVERRPYTGKTYCPQVDSTYVLARYRDRIYVAGQCQNLSRGGALRQSMCAPPGHVVLAVDSNQIEARLNAWVAGEADLLAQFARGEDVYANFASKLYNREITAATDPFERRVGKLAILSLGYGAGGNKFEWMAQAQDIKMRRDEAWSVVDRYRTTYPSIAALWHQCEVALHAMLQGNRLAAIGPCVCFGNEITLPNNMPLQYHNLRVVRGKGMVYKFGNQERHIYGAKLAENIIQALAFVIIKQQLLKVPRHWKFAMQAHDELVFVVKEGEADEALETIKGIMSESPTWATDLPLAADGGYGSNYLEAK